MLESGAVYGYFWKKVNGKKLTVKECQLASPDTFEGARKTFTQFADETGIVYEGLDVVKVR